MSWSILILIVSLHRNTLAFGSWPSWLGGDYDDPLADVDRIVFPVTEDDYYPTGWHLTTTTRRPLPVNNLQACVSSCPVTPYNPICGTDDVTYQNIDRLKCVARCGHDVQVRQWSPCTTAPSPTNPKKNLQVCIAQCPSTPEYLPVCGTDNVTYNNIGKLYCAKNCGVDVDLKRRAPCSPRPIRTIPDTTTTSTNNIQKCLADCPVTSENNPVCGSNDVTYNNIGRLDCARRCGVDVSLRGRSACFLLTSTKSPVITSRSTTLIDVPFSSMTTKSTDFTIPQYILDSIFNSSPVHEDDKEPIIDARDDSV